MISSIRRIAENSFLADHSQLFAFLSSNREGTTALRAVAPSLYLCILRKHDRRLFTNNRLCSIIELTSDLHKPFPPDCAAMRRKPSGGYLRANHLSSKRATPLCGVAPLSAYFTYMGIQLPVISQTDSFYQKPAFHSRQPPPPDCAAQRRSPAGKRNASFFTYPPRTTCAA